MSSPRALGNELEGSDEVEEPTKLTWALAARALVYRTAAHFPSISLTAAHRTGVSASSGSGTVIDLEKYITHLQTIQTRIPF